MAPNVVSCPGCGKKYRIPADSDAPDFQCTACGETIPLEAPESAGRGRSRGGGVRDRRRQSRARKSSNTGVYMACGILGLAAVVAVVIVLMTQDKGPKGVSNDPRGESGAPPRAEGPVVPATVPDEVIKPRVEEPDPLIPEPEVEPDPEPERPVKPVEPEKPPPTDDIQLMTWDEIVTKLGSLEHAKGTSESLKSEIDQLVETMLDFTSGGDGFKAKDRLVEIGKAAVPRILRGLANFKFVSIEDRASACVADEALRMITNYTRLDQLKPVIEKPDLYKRVVKYHLKYWEEHKHLEGDAFRVKGPEDDEDEDEEDDD